MAAVVVLPIILSGLAAVGGGKIAWDKYRRPKTQTPYDVIIRMNSLSSLQTSGWEILLGQTVPNTELEVTNDDNTSGVVVAVLGSYNRGKSYLLNQLCNLNLPSGNLIHTEGISITVGRQNVQNVIFIDTAGADTAIPKDKLDDKKATEALLREIALHLCSFIIIVVNRLRATDQIYIHQILMHLQISNHKKNIIIVHNLMDVESEEDAKTIITNEIEGILEAKPEQLGSQMHGQSIKVKFFRSSHKGINLRHFILAKNGSPAAKIWNGQSIDGIMNILQTATDYRRNLNIITEMIGFINTKLPQLFIDNEQNENASHENHHHRLQIEQHSQKPYIVLSCRKDMEDLERDPCRLTLSPKLIYDDAGYFIGISSMNNSEWQPLYSLYENDEEILVVIELAGLGKGSITATVIEEAISVEGYREDFKKTFKTTTVHQEKIPFGKFNLKIPLNCKIENKEAKPVREEGLYKIICPKKKITAVYLD